ncbi:MAG: cytochrome P450, partial [Anaerolineales bacterium]|nr:cytochrome P450 [Anaerolineales bacterium]
MMLLMMEFVNYLNILFDERQANPGDDLITGLIQAEEEGDKLSREELFSMLVLLIVAGHETTVGLIGNGAFALLQDQALMARLKENPADVAAAVEEFLRYDGPVERVFVRWAAEDLELGGQFIKRGEAVISVIAAANRDPELFERPHELDIDRPQNKHMAFGKGVHFCLGAPLARLEGEVAFQALLARLPNLRLNVAPEAAEVRWSPGLRNFVSLPVRWDPSE